MFTLSNLRSYVKDGWKYLACDFDVTGIKNPFPEKTMWVSVREEDGDMLAENVYDPFVLAPVYLGMHYGQDVRIEGNVSPRLWHNTRRYITRIFDLFSDYTRPVNISAAGFDTVTPWEKERLVGTGASCGVDSLTTIYNNFVKETDPAFRINALFFVNSGTHGDFADKETERLYNDRAKLNGDAVRELGLPLHLVNSNYHAFANTIGSSQIIVYLSIYSCVLSLQRAIRRYYTSSNLAYEEIAEFHRKTRDFDIAEFSESYMAHLISTEIFELVIDGCEYTRGEKTALIADWDFARRHLNVCVADMPGAKNCSKCNKCMRTQLTLDAIGKLDAFTEVFNPEIYKKHRFRCKVHYIAGGPHDQMERSVSRFAKSRGMKFPPKPLAKVLHWGHRALRAVLPIR